MATDAQIRAVLRRLRLAFPHWAQGRDGRDIDGSFLLYCERLRSFDADLLEQAGYELIDQGKHFPCIAEVKEACRTIVVREKQRERERPWWQKTPPELNEKQRARFNEWLTGELTRGDDRAREH